MIVVAIIGIPAAIALPAYQDYTAHIQVSEVVAAAGAVKSSISEYYRPQGACPADGTYDIGPGRYTASEQRVVV